ncbi:peptidoglycan DD-metalloendopeptidase family protein [Pseudoclavibacter sp. CFCC 13796]|uniref:phage tail tip lysozyme n=1 Tax=Pseudoclavibacter sp. CFCC 13796 TaxID=2615179 RepID=UPI00130120C1|nr:phage tail tip lysozyme [Pseudoclavibacter sp. CFCC 13796]KAB1661605.1 peptidoglycan DD-metalloendopeptidase family protein [Pseudoclavibacter sp. CFCC 13796]
MGLSNVPWAVVAFIAFIVILLLQTRHTRHSHRRQTDPQRVFTKEQRQRGSHRCGGRCEHKPLFGRRCSSPGAHGDHIYPWSFGGATAMSNYQHLCARHNLAKSNHVPSKLYIWRLERRRRHYFPQGGGPARGVADGKGQMTIIHQLRQTLAVTVTALTVAASFGAGVILSPASHTPTAQELSRTAMVSDGVTPALITRAEAATLGGQQPNAPVAADVSPDDVAHDPGTLDDLFAQRENDRVTLNSIELSWMLAAGQALQSKGVNLYDSTELKWKLGVTLQVLDPDSTKRHMTTDARYVPAADDNHYELPAESEQNTDVKQRIEDTKKLYVALGRVAGLDDSAAEQVYKTGLRWALGQKATCGSGSTSGNGKLEGNGNLEKIYTWLMTGPGFTAEQASGIVANIEHESGGDPAATNGSFTTSHAYGIAQWINGRHEALRDTIKQKLGDKFYVSTKSSPPASEVLTPEELDQLLQVELDFLQQELQTGFKHVDAGVRATSTPEDAAEVWVRKFEIPENMDYNVQVRRASATEWYAAHQGSSSASSDTSSSTSSDTSTADTPVTKGSNIALYGDSLSVGIITKWTGSAVDGEWASDAQGSNGNAYRGGWAKVGASSATVADNAKPVDGADVAVVMAGTNDQGSWGSGDQAPVANVERALKATGQSNLVVAAVAPSDANGEGSKTYNDALKQVAERNSWKFVDPWTELRADDGRYKDEFRSDGTHPNDAGYQKAADALSSLISSGNKTAAQTCSQSGGDTSGAVPQFVGDIAMPLATMIQGSNYGMRLHPTLGKMRFHYGTDYPVPTGTAVFAIADGTVQRASSIGGCGNTVEIFHNINGNQIATRYCHLSQLEVSAGDTVAKGQEIAKSGNTTGGTGTSTGPHLHFEVRTSWSFDQDWQTAGNSVDSDAWLKAQGHS